MQVLSINEEAIHKETFTLQYRLMDEPLFLICTNGRRDPCCAKWGLPLYNALEKIPGVSVWQSSHVGGHRFAGNMICLPHGIYYVRVSPDNAISVVDHYRAGQIDLYHYRGRASYSSIVQVGEYYLRQQIADFQLDSVQFKSAIETNPDHWEVIFTSNLVKKTYRLHIVTGLSDQMIFESCSGAGFGGCTVNLVQRAQAPAFVAALRIGYQAAVQSTPEIYVCTASRGAEILN